MNVCSKCNTVVETYEGLSTHVCGKQPPEGSCTQPTSTNSASDEIATLKAEVEWLKGEFKVLKEMFEFYVRCCGDVSGFHL